MYIRDIYETVVLTAPCPQHVFLSQLDTTVRSLISKYGGKRVIHDRAYVTPTELNGDLPVREEFQNAIVSNILYLVTREPDFKNDYVAEAEYAFLTLWRRGAKRLRIVGEDYYHV